MATRARAARLLTLDAAGAFDRGERCDMQAGMAKYFASEAALENSTESMRIHGAYGYSKEYDIERLYRDAPLTCIGEGTERNAKAHYRPAVGSSQRVDMKDKPLKGIRVLTLEQFGARPYGTMFMAEPRRRSDQGRSAWRAIPPARSGPIGSARTTANISRPGTSARRA